MDSVILNLPESYFGKSLEFVTSNHNDASTIPEILGACGFSQLCAEIHPSPGLRAAISKGEV